MQVLCMQLQYGYPQRGTPCGIFGIAAQQHTLRNDVSSQANTITFLNCRSAPPDRRQETSLSVGCSAADKNTAADPRRTRCIWVSWHFSCCIFASIHDPHPTVDSRCIA